MKIAYFWLTSKGKNIAEKISEIKGGHIFEKENLKKNTEKAFREFDALIFIMATGIAVRTIAPLIQSKLSDPAILVISQDGKFVISLLSGHIGGANRLTYEISDIINAVPVVTTATDTENVIAFDEYAIMNNMKIENPENIKYISSDLIEGREVDLISSINTKISEKNVCIVKEYRGKNSVVIDIGLKIKNPVSHILYLRPRIIHIGTGCKKNTDSHYFEECFLDFLEKNNVNILSVKNIATVSLKKNEKCIQDLCRKYNIELNIIDNDEIEKHSSIFNGSDFVKQITGVSSVAEGSCYISSEKGKIICEKTIYKGVTFAMASEI